MNRQDMGGCLLAVIAAVVVIVVGGIVIVAGWSAGWWFTNQNTNREAHMKITAVVILLFLAAVFGVAALAARWEHGHTAVSRAGKARTAGHGSVPQDPAAPPGRLSAEDQAAITWVGYLTDPRMQPPPPQDGFWGEMSPDRCDVDWGSATTSQRCTRPAAHGGVHVDGDGREWGYVPASDPWGDEDGSTRAHIMSSSPGRDVCPVCGSPFLVHERTCSRYGLEAGRPGNDGREGPEGERGPKAPLAPVSSPSVVLDNGTLHFFQGADGNLRQVTEDDYQRWPHLRPGYGYSDQTGSFAAICEED